MTRDRLLLASSLTAIIVGAALGVRECRQLDLREREHEKQLEERYSDGVSDGQCERDCQYTHGDSLQVEVTGAVNGYGTCVCTRALGEPDWESSP